jgi:hypothetical protein
LGLAFSAKPGPSGYSNDAVASCKGKKRAVRASSRCGVDQRCYHLDAQQPCSPVRRSTPTGSPSNLFRQNKRSSRRPSPSSFSARKLWKQGPDESSWPRASNGPIAFSAPGGRRRNDAAFLSLHPATRCGLRTLSPAGRLTRRLIRPESSAQRSRTASTTTTQQRWTRVRTCADTSATLHVHGSKLGIMARKRVQVHGHVIQGKVCLPVLIYAKKRRKLVSLNSFHVNIVSMALKVFEK